jgi:hypothetical protein
VLAVGEETGNGEYLDGSGLFESLAGERCEHGLREAKIGKSRRRHRYP